MRYSLFLLYFLFNLHYFFNNKLVFIANLILIFLSSYETTNVFFKFLFYIANYIIFWITISYSELNFLLFVSLLLYLEYNIYIKFIEDKYKYIGILVLNDLIFNILKIFYDANIIGTYLFYTNHHKIIMLYISYCNLMMLNSTFLSNNSIKIFFLNILCLTFLYFCYLLY